MRRKPREVPGELPPRQHLSDTIHPPGRGNASSVEPSSRQIAEGEHSFAFSRGGKQFVPTAAFQVGGERQAALQPKQGFQADSPDPEGFALQLPDTVEKQHILQLLEMLPGEPPG